jgi:hypothetical protein
MSASRQLPKADVGIPAYVELSGATFMGNSKVCDQLCTIKSKAPDFSAQRHGLTVLGHPSTPDACIARFVCGNVRTSNSM